MILIDIHICSMSGRHLSQFSRWGASHIGKRRTATLDLHMLHASYPHWTHVILRISPTYKPVLELIQYSIKQYSKLFFKLIQILR